MAEKAKEVYEAAKSRLDELWAGLDHAEPPSEDVAAKVASAIKGGGVGQRYGIITQLVLKVVLPEVDCRRLAAFDGAPSGFSSRTLAKRAVVPFDLEHGAALGGSKDPYVTNPLRREQLDASMSAETTATPNWMESFQSSIRLKPTLRWRSRRWSPRLRPCGSGSTT